MVTKGEKFLIQVAVYSKMTSRLTSDKVIWGVLEEDCRLPEEESSEKESDSILVFARSRL